MKSSATAGAVMSILALFMAFSAIGDSYKDFRTAIKAATGKYRARDYSNASKIAETALKMAKNSDEKANANCLLGRIATREKKFEDALRFSKLVLDDEKVSSARKTTAYIVIADSYNARKNYGNARAALDNALALPDLSFYAKFDLLNRKAWTYEREGNWKAARIEYKLIISNAKVDKRWWMRSNIAHAKTFASESEYDKAVSFLNKLLTNPKLSERDRKYVIQSIANVYKKNKEWSNARDEYRKLFKFTGLKDSDKTAIYRDIIMVDINEGNFKGAFKNIDELLSVKGGAESADIIKVLKKMTWLIHRRRSTVKQEFRRRVFEKIIQLPAMPGKDKAMAYFALLPFVARNGDVKMLNKLLLAAATDKLIPPTARFKAKVILAGFTFPEKPETLQTGILRKLASGFKANEITPQLMLDAAMTGGSIFTILGDYKRARVYQTLCDDLFKKSPRKKYLCRYIPQPPLGAAGWFLSDKLKNKKFRESGRFVPYNQKDAAKLVSDINVTRMSKSNPKNKLYFKNTAFYMLYDKAGWHMFVLSGEPNMEKILAEGKKAGALEMYFTTGKGEAYYQWIIGHPKGKLSVFDWGSPYRNYRKLADYLKTETVAYDNSWGTYIFIPWVAIYDKLPLNGNDWPFGFIRWSPGGGVSWGEGGRVHEIGKWGLVEWEKPSPEVAGLIRSNILKKAWGKYKNIRKVETARWKDPELGDPKFYATTLAPAIAELDKIEKRINSLDKMGSDEIKKLYEDAVGDLMEFNYKVAELRKRYLERGFMTSTKKGDIL